MNLNEHRQKDSFVINRSQYLPETQSDFERLLNRLRPKAHSIEVVYQHDSETNKIGCLIYCDGDLKHAIEPIHKDDGTFYDKNVAPVVKFYKNPPRLWPGCRGDVARACHQRINTQFNRWFDTLADKGKHRSFE